MTLFIIHATVDVAAVLFPSQREELAKTAYIFSFSVKELQNEPLTLWLVSQPCLPLLNVIGCSSVKERRSIVSAGSEGP